MRRIRRASGQRVQVALDAGGRVHGGAAQPHEQRLGAAEHQQRQVAVLPVVAMVEAPLLAAVQRHVGGVQVQHQLLRRRPEALREQLRQQRVEAPEVRHHLAMLPVQARRRRQLQPVQRALARQRLAVVAALLQAAQHRAQQRVLAQRVVIVQILVAQRHAEDALTHQRLHLVHDVGGVAVVGEAGRHPAEQPDRLVGQAHEQRAAVGGQGAAREIGFETPRANAVRGCAAQPRRVTVCRGGRIHAVPLFYLSIKGL